MNELMNYNNYTNNIKNDDTSLLKYAKDHQNSYIVMWKLIDKFSNKNYKQLYDSVYQCLSKKLRSDFTGKELGKYILSAKSFRIGSDFPDLKVTDQGKPIDLKAKLTSDQFTLIDFWYSECGPCIGQFDELKRIYSIYKKEGFNIVGISNESIKTIEKWRVVIDNYKLPWKQYIDMNGFECNELNINIFPSNFLINQEGKIIAMNLNPNELNVFLDKHLK
jgi:peroxiredoxin